MNSNNRHNNPPAAILELDDDTVKFLLENCDANINLGLRIMQRAYDGDDSVSETTLRKMIDTNEKFKSLKKLIHEAMINNDRRI